jgi:hypothetical protein
MCLSSISRVGTQRHPDNVCIRDDIHHHLVIERGLAVDDNGFKAWASKQILKKNAFKATPIPSIPPQAAPPTTYTPLPTYKPLPPSSPTYPNVSHHPEVSIETPTVRPDLHEPNPVRRIRSSRSRTGILNWLFSRRPRVRLILSLFEAEPGDELTIGLQAAFGMIDDPNMIDSSVPTKTRVVGHPIPFEDGAHSRQGMLR